MSQHSIHVTPASVYTTYNPSSNVQPSRNSAYAPATNHYNQHHVAKSVSLADINPDDIDLNHPANWGIFDDPSQPPRRPKWERKSSAATQPYPVKNHDSSRHTIPTTSGAGRPASYSSYQTAFDKHASGIYGGTSLQSSPYSSTCPLPQGNYSHPAHVAPLMAGNVIAASTPTPNHGFPAPYAGMHTYPTASASIPSQGSSIHGSPSRAPTSTSAQPRPLSPGDWHQPLSQASHLEAPSAEPHDKDRHKSRKPARHSKLDGIPRDQMQRFRIVDMGPGLSSSSGSKRTRSPGSEVLPDAKVRATVQGDANGGSKGKGKANLSLEDKQLLEKRKKEADRVQTYRDSLEDAYAELRALLYSGGESPTFVSSNHGKQRCIRDAIKCVRNWQQKEIRLEAHIRALEAERRTEVAERHALIAENNAHKQLISELRETVDYLQTCLTSVKGDQT